MAVKSQVFRQTGNLHDQLPGGKWGASYLTEKKKSFRGGGGGKKSLGKAGQRLRERGEDSRVLRSILGKKRRSCFLERTHGGAGVRHGGR